MAEARPDVPGKLEGGGCKKIGRGVQECAFGKEMSLTFVTIRSAEQPAARGLQGAWRGNR
jgi:hypothetical protein